MMEASALRPAGSSRGEADTSRMIAGIAVTDLSGAAVIAALAGALASGRTTRLAFLNAHCVNLARRHAAYKRALERFVVIPDGIGVDIAARMLYGKPFTENLNGTDFLPRLLAALDGRLRVALIGGAPGIAGRAAARLAAEIPAHDYIVVSHGFFDHEACAGVLDDLAAAEADIVLVAMGVPAQELFIADHLDARHGRLFVGVGALFDFLAGNVARAPLAVRRARMEWVWRLMLEPGRMWRRYILGNPRFLLGILRDRSRRERPDD
ncbi:WecB/TagA/CpsF family glycosyltransferase [Aurantimonas marianensis]|uniref:WecB/TagA/CpsF family glycosyltransferase n=1 Tax=Aurantimonas marianensis TaxID=2920428 RepID=A0A9X2H3W6_9HYPH|nr:WecB/TagA/CpsF family glycosyltransferase [Aurantimonas marianensis]MCP3053716.1 WecB/TagA/CpsF family glycosyltransferase [Aurantimonas marianensis]